MNFFGVGPLELVLILIVALVFVGPERLPRLAADLARTIREIRKYTGSLAAEFQEVVNDVDRQTQNERTVWKDVSEGIGGATQQVTEAMRGVRQDLRDAGDAAGGTDRGAAAPTPAPGDVASPPTNGTPKPGAWVQISEPTEEIGEEGLEAAPNAADSGPDRAP